MIGLRKFFLTFFASASGLMLCWNHCITGVDFVALQSIVLGMYKLADVMNRRTDSANEH